MPKQRGNRLSYARRFGLVAGLAYFWVVGCAGCSRTMDGGPEVLPKKFPGAVSQTSGAKTPSTTAPTSKQ
jgi:hypothetical protein